MSFVGFVVYVYIFVGFSLSFVAFVGFVGFGGPRPAGLPRSTAVGVGLLSRVGFQVGSQMSMMNKSLGAILAYIRFLFRVYAQVALQMTSV